LLLLFPAFVAAPPLSLTHFASDGYCTRRAKYVVNPTRLIIAFLECCLHWILIFAAASERAHRRYLHLRDRRQPECTLQIMKRRARCIGKPLFSQRLDQFAWIVLNLR
jgi:hypothetical protein